LTWYERERSRRKENNIYNFLKYCHNHTIIFIFIYLNIYICGNQMHIVCVISFLSTIIYLFYILLIIIYTSADTSVIRILRFCILSKFVVMVIRVFRKWIKVTLWKWKTKFQSNSIDSLSFLMMSDNEQSLMFICT